MVDRLNRMSYAPELERLLGQLISGDILFFPIRHHSPACAWHLQRLIEQYRRTSILVEGPANFTPLIPLILHPRTRTPFAVYTTYVDTTRRVNKSLAKERGDFGPARFAAYYPFCNYSPELVALRSGIAAGARLQFIDLDYPRQVLSEKPADDLPAAPRVDSLLEERHLKRSAYLKQLAKRTGCRDQDELWDHLFEVNYAEVSTETFVKNVAAYCYMARHDYLPDELAADGTRAREQSMAKAIREERAAGRSGNILVVTGGFHTVVLPDMLHSETDEQKLPIPDGESISPVLIRYSFDQLDSLNGYAAGMPSPHYYDQFWDRAIEGQPRPFLETAANLLVEIGRLTREKSLPNALSTADEIAALEQARRLALLRGHVGPTREDLLDGVRSCFVKGSMDAEGAVLMGIARHVLSGTAIGDIPPEAGAPPLVENFRAVAIELRLNITESVRRKLSLDIYRSVAHRTISRFFHSLSFLQAPFAALVAGPNFVQGTGLQRLQEHWDYFWSPRTESALVEASVYGSTVEEAAANRLRQDVINLEQQGRGRSALEAVRMLVMACRMGLHRHTKQLLDLIAGNVVEDSSFVSVVQAMNQLLLLWQSREPLEAHHLPEIPSLLRIAYERACYLVRGLASSPQEEIYSVLQAFNTIREALAAVKDDLLDADLFWQEVAALPAIRPANSAVVGGAAGLVIRRQPP